MNQGMILRDGARTAEKLAGVRERNVSERERIQAAERYLSEYRTMFRMLRAGMGGLCQDGWGVIDTGEHESARWISSAHGTLPDDDRMWEEKLLSIRTTVLSVAEPDEKIFLFQHYIRGNTVEVCAELLDISVRTAYRLKKRALLTVSEMI